MFEEEKKKITLFKIHYQGYTFLWTNYTFSQIYNQRNYFTHKPERL